MTHIDNFDHVITSAEVKESHNTHGSSGREEIYKLFIYADGIPLADGRQLELMGMRGMGIM